MKISRTTSLLALLALTAVPWSRATAVSGGGTSPIGKPYLLSEVWDLLGVYSVQGVNDNQVLIASSTDPVDVFNTWPCLAPDGAADRGDAYADATGVFWTYANRVCLARQDTIAGGHGTSSDVVWSQQFTKDVEGAWVHFTVSKAFLRLFSGGGYFGNGGHGARTTLSATGELEPAAAQNLRFFDQFVMLQYTEAGGFDAPIQEGPMFAPPIVAANTQDLEYAPYTGSVDLSGLVVGEKFWITFRATTYAESGNAEIPAVAQAFFRDPLGTGGGIVIEADGVTPLDVPPAAHYPRDQAHALAIQPDGKLVAAGFALGAAGYDFALARYLPDGALDPGFGAGGRVTTDFANGPDFAAAVALQPDGRIVVAGSAASPAGADFAVARYLADGTLDPSFGAGGKVVVDVAGQDDQAYAVVIQPDGSILLAGSAWNGTGNDAALVRVDASGALDPTFGVDGTLVLGFGAGSGAARALVLQADGKILVAGHADPLAGTAADFLLARLDAGGALDPSFGTAGLAAADFARGTDLGRALALQPDGKIVVAGVATGVRGDLAVARYDAAGQLDPTFGAGGRVTLDVAGGDDRAAGVALQPDGKIVLAGSATLASGLDFALARLDAGGALDPTFGVGGLALVDFEGGEDRAQALALQADGAIVAAGYATTAAGGEDFALVRLLP